MKYLSFKKLKKEFLIVLCEKVESFKYRIKLKHQIRRFHNE